MEEVDGECVILRGECVRMYTERDITNQKRERKDKKKKERERERE